MHRAIQSMAFAVAFSTCLLCLPAFAFANEGNEPIEPEAAIQAPEATAAPADDTEEDGKTTVLSVGETEKKEPTDNEVVKPVEQATDEKSSDSTGEPSPKTTTMTAATTATASQTSTADTTATAKATSQTTASASAVMTAAASASASIADGVYTIVSSVGGSKCLDVPGGSSNSGVGLQIYSQNATAAQRWSIRALGGGLFEIVNVGSGKALDVSGARKADGTTVQQYTRNSTAAQKWKIVSVGSGQYKILSALSDSYVLDVSGAKSANGTRVQLWSDNGTKAQKWSLVSTKVINNGFYVVKNSNSKKALDVSGGSLSNGGNVQQYQANSTPAQTYYFSYNSSNGYYTITDLGSGKVLDVSGGSSARGANVQQYTPNGTKAQRWAALKNSDGSYTFRSSISGLALDVSGASTANSANVQVWTANGTGAQKWQLTSVSNWISEGCYTIISGLTTANAVDISGGSTSNGANVRMYKSNATNAQRFYLRSAGSGFYTIQNPVSGKYVNVVKSASGANVVLGTTKQQFKPVFGAGGITFQLKDNTSLVLDVSGASTNSGANLQLYKSNGTLAQKFVIKTTDLLAEGTYSIRYAANTDYVVDVPGASKDDGKQVQLYESNGTAAQRYRLARVAANTYTITSSCSSKVLQVVKVGSTYQVQQKKAASSTSQQWELSLDADGTMQLAPKSNKNLRFDLSSNTVANTTPIDAYASNNSAAQKWKFVSEKDSTTYDTLGLTLRRMAELQKESSYYASLTVSQLMDLLDPDKLDKTQFLDLRTVTNATAAQLNAFIVSTSTGQSGVLKGLGSSFTSAAKQYGLNEVYLLAHAILESGWGTSDLARGYYYGGGTIDGTYYSAGTYYNFYGIGAYDSSPLSGGRKLAIINGWNSREKAVTGAAKWIADNYVYASSYAQPTLYAMKWDYARSDATGERGWHQYATGTSWPESIARLINQCYDSIGGNSNAAYVIPKYK